MNNFFEYEDYLRISDEIELNTIVSNLEMMMLINEKQMDEYDEETSQGKICELMTHIFMLQELMNKAMIHNAYEVYDKCQVYIIDAEYQMEKLRNKYMI